MSCTRHRSWPAASAAGALHVALKRIGIVASAAALLVVSQPDLGTTLVITFTLGAMIVTAGVRLRMVVYALPVAAVLVLGFSLANPYAFDRLTSFVNPWAHSKSTGYQAVQGQVAIGSGGLLGRGLGGGVTKDDWLPNGSTDFILAVIGEEAGVVGVCAVLFLYGLIIFCGLRIAAAARESYSLLLAAGGDFADRGAGRAECLRGPQPCAADRRSTPVRVLRLLEPARNAHRTGRPACRRARERGWSARGGAHARTKRATIRW